MSTPGEYRLSPPTRASENANASRPSTNDNQTTEPNDSSIDSLDNPGLAVQQSRGGMSSILMMTIVLFMLTNNGGEDMLVRNQYRESLGVLRAQQGNFSAWLWSGGNEFVNSSAGMNFTLPEVETSSITLAHSALVFGVPLHPHLASYYSNMTGFMHGQVEIYNLTSNSSTELTESNMASEVDAEVPFVTIPILRPPPWGHLASEFTKNINMTAAIEHLGSWNWSSPMEMAFRVIEKQPTILTPRKSFWGVEELDNDAKRMNESVWSGIGLMHGRIELTDRLSGEELNFDMEAVHFVENGTIYGLAEPSGRHVDVREIPSLVPTPYVNATAQAVNAELLSRIRKLQDTIENGVIEVDTSQEEAPKTSCPFMIFGQLIPTSVPLDRMHELESEMENPTGISTVSRPELRMNAILMSKECGILLELRSAEGLKSQRFWRKVTTYSGTAALVYLALLSLLMRQLKVGRTPEGVSRVSRWTFLTQAAADSISFVGHITFGILAEGRPSFSLIAPAFLAAVLVVFEAQHSILIHQIQQPEEFRANPPTPPPPPTSSGQTEAPINQPTESNSPSTESTSPIQSQGVARPAATPNTAPAPSRFRRLSRLIWQEIWNSPQARFLLVLIFALILFVRVLISPSVAMLTLSFVYGNFWTPQIVRSARRGMPSGLRAEYLLGTTACRAYFALYLFACPKNVLSVELSSWVFLVLGVQFLQVFVIMLQDWLGTGFFLPWEYKPISKYNYHPSIPLPDDEAPEPSLGDCAICMDAILVEPETHLHRRSMSLSGFRRSTSSTRSVKDREREKEQERGVKGILDRLGAATRRNSVSIKGTGARRSYALAPCHHLFHTACLERWLAIKNICPQCRRPLPPL